MHASATPDARWRAARSRRAPRAAQPTKDGDGLPQTAVREVALLTSLSHANVVHLEKAHINHEDGTLSLVRRPVALVPRLCTQRAYLIPARAVHAHC